jgi:hypothetical protein
MNWKEMKWDEIRMSETEEFQLVFLPSPLYLFHVISFLCPVFLFLLLLLLLLLLSFHSLYCLFHLPTVPNNLKELKS